MSSGGPARMAATVKGRVQGVGYRYFAETEANRLGLSGYVRNLPSGNVEVVAEGDERVLQGFLARLRQGPYGAEVSDIQVSFSPPSQEFAGFSIRRWF